VRLVVWALDIRPLGGCLFGTRPLGVGLFSVRPFAGLFGTTC